MSKIERATSISTVDNDSDGWTSQFPQPSYQQVERVLANYGKIEARLTETLRQNSLLQEEVALLRKQNTRLSKKKGRLEESLQRQAGNVAFLQGEIQRLEAQLFKSEQQGYNKVETIQLLEQVLRDQSAENQQLRKRVEWISARFAVELKQAQEKAVHQPSDNTERELQNLREAYQRLKRCMSRKLLSRQAELSSQIDFVLSDDEFSAI